MRDYLKFTAIENDTKINYFKMGSFNADIGYSRDGSTFVASELPATILAPRCYVEMFSYSRLETGPDIKAITLANNSLSSMFRDCSNLNSIKLAYTGNFDFNYFSGWVSDVPNSGNFYYSGSDTSNFGVSAIPKDSTHHWNVLPYTQ